MNVRTKLRLLGRAPKPEPRPGTWPLLAEPIFAADNDAIARAKSLLVGVPFRDGETHTDLTPAQARDVVRAFGP